MQAIVVNDTDKTLGLTFIPMTGIRERDFNSGRRGFVFTPEPLHKSAVGINRIIN